MVDPFKMKVAAGWPKSKCLSIKPLAQNKVTYSELYDYGDAATFAKKVDNSLAGQMRDCAECHVGGGGMEYVMAAKGADLSAVSRLSLRDLGTGSDTYGTAGAAVASTNFTSVNYFVDQYDEDNDGILGEVLENDYSVTGVMEMDCLMCHMEGYSWSDRKEAVRKGNFDSSRAAGAGLGTVVTGTTVSYDGALVVDDGSGNASLAASVLDAIKGAPPSANCSSCHFDLHQVDWKKRGTSWTATMNYETEVHASIGCMGCHERTDGGMNAMGGPTAGGWSGSATVAGVLGHDPSKQFAPYSSLWNKTDAKGGAKTCASCHVDQIAENLGAADPTAAHTALGLLAPIAQNGRDGVADATHLDIIACDACHTRKLGRGPSAAEGGSTHGSLYEWGTGGALVDSTGVDADGRLTDHENLYVERTMEDNLVRGWSGGKMSSRHGLLTMFWRDKHDLFGYGNAPAPNEYVDINADGQTGAMDAVNPSHVRDAMAAAGLHVLTHDGVITDAEISAQKAALISYLPTVGINLDPAGTGATVNKLKLSFMGVLFRANHGTSPASVAWGAGGCTDCHGADAGFYNGSYDMKPRDLDASWTNWDGSSKDNSAIGGKKPKWRQVVPFTKVNKDNYSGRDVNLPICSTYYGPNARPALPTMGAAGSEGTACTEGGTSGTWTLYPLGYIKADYQYTDFHPTLWAKGMTSRSLAVTAAFANTNTIRSADRSEFLYGANEVTPSGPGARTMVDGTVATGRSGIVGNLNDISNLVTFLDGNIGPDDNFNPGLHRLHLAMDTSVTCTDCHDDTGGLSYDTLRAAGTVGTAGVINADNTFTPTPETMPDGCNEFAVDNADGITGTADDYVCVDVVPGALTGAMTCTTACHEGRSIVTPGNPTADASSATGTDVTASAGAIHAISDNNIITVNAQRSSCTGDYNSECTYAWNEAGCTQIGGSADGSVAVFEGTDGVDCVVSVDVTDSETAETVNSGNVTVAANGTLDPTGPVGSDVASLDNGDGTCTVSASDLDGAVNARIYWGNRESQSVDVADLAGGVTNYCGANVRITLIDAAHNAATLNL
jgi:hypothetical protein